ncbi:tryptophan 2,3-dioxygenase [Acrocarpospora phusangensis]|uniref:Tryptophan 2,3-dioxygenase n=1 Tax=Acrocarpospora phusangensis TaxID=1070424 RepID=A0A919Q502_9ACTN|nr:tryptophan 2,3-dioxygenase family protein [Acrocarpospora phusangensis]GIH21726.1 tryptophan 2,3-dioxygenase [Acrocarpospora phusangensis]
METTDRAVRPSNAGERAARAAANAGEPTLEFVGGLPYDAYVHAGTLHSLQKPISKDPGEMSFLMISQIMELYFGLTCFELREAQRLLREDDVWGALGPLRRACLDIEGLNAAWRGLRWMTPADFNRFRDQLGEASGFQSAMYRHLEFLLGLRNAALLRPFHRHPEAYEALLEAMRAPSLWDDVIAVLARRGFGIPRDLLDRDVAAEHERHPAVEAAWVDIYRDETPGNPLWMLGEALTELADGFGDWRYQHLKAVQRSMGEKSGSGGSAGAAWLRRSMDRVVFPEIWSARTLV